MKNIDNIPVWLEICYTHNNNSYTFIEKFGPSLIEDSPIAIHEAIDTAILGNMKQRKLEGDYSSPYSYRRIR